MFSTFMIYQLELPPQFIFRSHQPIHTTVLKCFNSDSCCITTKNFTRLLLPSSFSPYPTVLVLFFTWTFIIYKKGVGIYSKLCLSRKMYFFRNLFQHIGKRTIKTTHHQYSTNIVLLFTSEALWGIKKKKIQKSNKKNAARIRLENCIHFFFAYVKNGSVFVIKCQMNF